MIPPSPTCAGSGLATPVGCSQVVVSAVFPTPTTHTQSASMQRGRWQQGRAPGSRAGDAEQGQLPADSASGGLSVHRCVHRSPVRGTGRGRRPRGVGRTVPPAGAAAPPHTHPSPFLNPQATQKPLAGSCRSVSCSTRASCRQCASRVGAAPLPPCRPCLALVALPSWPSTPQLRPPVITWPLSLWSLPPWALFGPVAPPPPACPPPPPQAACRTTPSRSRASSPRPARLASPTTGPPLRPMAGARASMGCAPPARATARAALSPSPTAITRCVNARPVAGPWAHTLRPTQPNLSAPCNARIASC